MLKRYVIGFGAAVAVGAVIYGYGQLQFRAGKSAAKEEQYVTELESFKLQVIELNKTSEQFAALSQQLTRQYTQLSKSYDEIINQNPLPSDCFVDDYRLHIINEAIRDATAAGESSGTMSANRRTE